MRKEEIVHRLAKTCALGWKQESLVNELIQGKVYIRENKWGCLVGETGLGWSSWKNLRKRLVTAGFVVDESFDNKKIKMKWIY